MLISGNAAIMHMLNGGGILPPAVGDIHFGFDETSGSGGTAIDAEVSPDDEQMTAQGTILYNQPSLRADGAGTSIWCFDFQDAYTVREDPGKWFIPWANGMTFEILVKHDAISTRGSYRIAPAIEAIERSNVAEPNSMFVMRFDNFDDTAQTSVKPTLSVINRGIRYTSALNYATSITEEIRGTENMVLGKIYHLMCTFRPSDNTVEFWVDGVSQGVGTVPTAWFTDNPIHGDLLTGSGRTEFYVGSGLFGDANSVSGINSFYDDLRIHFLEADQAFVDRQIAGLL